MKLKLVPIQEEEKEILRNLLEKYLYEFSQYDGGTAVSYTHLDVYKRQELYR